MKNKTKYAIAVGDYSYSFLTDPQLVPMTWVERFDTLAEACAEINDSYECQEEDGCGGHEYDLTIIEESEIKHELARSVCGEDYREHAPNYEQPPRLAIKTLEGYLCNQGEESWFQAEPIGWALISTDPDWLKRRANWLNVENYTLEEV